MKVALKILAIVGVLLVQGALAWFLMAWMATSDLAPSAVPDGAGAETVEKAYEFGSIFMIHDLVVNPRSSKGRRIFKISLALEYDPENRLLADELKERSPFMRDYLIQYLGSMDENTLSDISYREQMRDSLYTSLNHFLREGQLDRVLFQDFIRQ
jgi:flagellar basal body-associated protein FliL